MEKELHLCGELSKAMYSTHDTAQKSHQKCSETVNVGSASW